MSSVVGKKLGKSEKSSLAGVNFGEFPQGCGGALKRKKGLKKTPTALFRVLHHKSTTARALHSYARVGDQVCDAQFFDIIIFDTPNALAGT